jgi:hypothetical protein
MSESPSLPAQDGANQTDDAVSISISQDVAQRLTTIAASRQVEIDTLVNQVLRHYIAGESGPQPEQKGPTFLLSLAGMFNSGTQDTSENVDTIVSDFIVQKREQGSS